MPPEEGPDDRVGVAGMRHVTGLYRVCSELRQRHPGPLADNCCGGGNRIDVETMRPLLQGDLYPPSRLCPFS